MRSPGADPNRQEFDIGPGFQVADNSQLQSAQMACVGCNRGQAERGALPFVLETHLGKADGGKCLPEIAAHYAHPMALLLEGTHVREPEFDSVRCRVHIRNALGAGNLPDAV